MNIKIKTIPEAMFYGYRLELMFDGYKWDMQEGEQSTISDKVILLGREEMRFLADAAVSLYRETIAMEQALKHCPALVREMGISEQMTNALCNCRYEPDGHVRLMRFDFHPSRTGWQISEVNSDVPAGYPEASILPKLAAKHFAGYAPHGDFAAVLTAELAKSAPANSTIAYLYDTHTVEDFQIMRFIGDLMERRGFESLYADPSHIVWEKGRALGIGAIMRYFPVEWLEYAKGADWAKFVGTKTPSCNHPIALLTQSKRLPLVWDRLESDIPVWKRLLPETVCTSALPESTPGWIFKPAFGRVGEGINIPGTLSEAENLAIKKAAAAYPLQWAAQRMFESVPVDGLHVSLGLFVVNGQYAGIFGRLSSLPKIDTAASEVPVLVKLGGT